MRPKSSTPETPSERLVRDIRRATRKQYGAGPALVQSLKLIVERKANGQSDYTFGSAPRSGDRYGADAIFALYRSALRQIATSAPDEARRLLALFDPTLHLLFRHLHLEAIAASGGALAGDCPTSAPVRQI